MGVLDLFRCTVEIVCADKRLWGDLRRLADGWILDQPTPDVGDWSYLTVPSGPTAIETLRSLRASVDKAWRRVGATQLVCSGVAEIDGGITVYSGPTRTGKTTRLLESLASGHDFFANDHAWLFPDGTIASLPSAVGIRGQVDAGLEVENQIVDARDGGLRTIVRPRVLADHFGVDIRGHGALRRTVLLDWPHPSRITPALLLTVGESETTDLDLTTLPPTRPNPLSCIDRIHGHHG